MNREDIIRMAREAGFLVDNDAFQGGIKLFERFAAFVAAAAVEREREACAKVCDSYALAEGVPGAPTWSEACAAAIRARSKQ